MEPATFIALVSILGGSTSVAAAIAAYSQRHKVRAEAAATAASSASAAVDSALRSQQSALDNNQARADRLSKKVDELEEEASALMRRARKAEDRLHALEQAWEREQLVRARLLNTFNTAIRYINALRQQLEKISETPLPWPPALEEWLMTYPEHVKGDKLDAPAS